MLPCQLHFETFAERELRDATDILTGEELLGGEELLTGEGLLAGEELLACEEFCSLGSSKT